MISLAVAVAATVAAVVCLALWLRAPQEAASQRAGYCAGVVGAAFLVALLSPAPVGQGYKAALIFGLVLTLLALPLLQSRVLPDGAGHAHLVWAYIVYAYGFASLTVWTWPSPWLLLPVAGAAMLYWRLFERLRDLWETIALYALVLVVVAWQALIWVLQAPAALPAWLGLGAVILIAAAHSVQAFARFRGLPTRLAAVAFPVLLAAQLLLAWSVWA